MVQACAFLLSAHCPSLTYIYTKGIQGTNNNIKKRGTVYFCKHDRSLSIHFSEIVPVLCMQNLQNSRTAATYW